MSHILNASYLRISNHSVFLQRHWFNPSVWLIVAVMPTVFTVIWWYNGLSDFRWDAAWYQNIASNGYQFDGNILRQQNVAFLPGYPLLVAVAQFIFDIGSARSEYMVSVACYIAGCLSLYQVLRAWCTSLQSATGVLIFSANPFSIYLFNGYSESLFFMLSSICFLGMMRKPIWVASAALSFALITRPHAVTLIPVLGFVIARDYGLLNLASSTKSVHWKRFIRVAIDQLFIVLIFPAILTFYWYVKFNDPLVYLNALTAWSGVGTSGVKGQMLFLLDGLTHFHFLAQKDFDWLLLPVLSPSNLAAIIISFNIVAVIILLYKKCYELAIYCVGLLIFWFAKSSPGDAGRHGLMLLALPVIMSLMLFPTWLLKPLNRDRTIIETLTAKMKDFIIISYLIFTFFHFCAYAYFQIRGGWIS